MSGEEAVCLELPATHKYLNLVGACVAEMLSRLPDLAEPEVAVYNLQLAAQEACTNIVEHAYAGREDGRIFVGLTLHPAPRRLEIELRDTGRAFDPATVREPQFDEAQERGFGLFLLHQLLDRVGYEARPTGNHWRLVKHL